VWRSSRGAQPVEIRRGLPGNPDDAQARYLEAEVHGLRIASVYLPNGNPQPGPKFDYKLAWFERLLDHAQCLRAGRDPAIPAGDFNAVPTDADIYNAWLWRFDAVIQPETRAAWRRLLARSAPGEAQWGDRRHVDPFNSTVGEFFIAPGGAFAGRVAGYPRRSCFQPAEGRCDGRSQA
jgi:exonuclease III